MKRIFLIFFVILGLLGNSLYGQERRVTGTVTQQTDGSTLPGVTVRVEGTGQGTITDMNGKYEITVAGTATLVFSYMGMNTETIAVNNRSIIDVALMTDISTLQEIVVTALGISRDKRTLGYSVQQVGAEELAQVRQTDAISALQGRVAGVQIRSSSNMGGSSKIIIRGASSMLGDNNPLMIVDGIPVDNSSFNPGGASQGNYGVDFGNMLNDIDPNEIESISVLKGAAAALYGSRAANGVIIITTKSAKKGKESLAIDITSSVDFDQIAIMPELQKKYGGGAIVSDAAGGKNGFRTITIGNKEYLYPTYWVDESWGPRYNPDLQVVHWWGAEDYAKGLTSEPVTAPWVAPKNGVESFWNLGSTINNTVGISKMGENYGIRTSYTNSATQGTLPGSSMNRHSFRINTNANLTQRLSINSLFNFTSSSTVGRPSLGYDGNSLGQQFFQWGFTGLDFDKLKEYKNPDGTHRSWNRESFAGSAPKYMDNPYWTAQENAPEDTRNRFLGNVAGTYKITDEFSIMGSINGDMYNFYTRERIAVGSKEQSWYREVARTKSEFNSNARLNYSKTFLGDLEVNALAGVETRKVKFEMNGGSTSGGMIVPNLYSLSNSNNDPTPFDAMEEKMVNSVLSAANFSYKRFLNIDLSARNDWSTSLPNHNNSYFYWGAAGSFVLTELVELPLIDLAKVRAGRTQVGNDTDPYRVYPTFGYNGNGGFASTPRLFVSGNMANPDLKAETTTTSEVGIDLVLLKNRIDFSATYFDKATTDMIISLQTSRSTGYASQLTNAGQLSTKGWEVSLGLVPVKTRDFQWNIRGNFTRAKQMVDELFGDIKTLDIATSVFSGVVLRASVGHEYGQLWGYDYIYDDAGNKVVGANGYWMRNPNLTPLGSVYPDYNLGIGNTFKYKNFDMGFLVDIQKGGVFYSVTHMWGMYSGMFPETAGLNDKGNEIRDAVADGGGIRLDGVKGTVTWNADGTYTVSNTSPNDTYVSGRGWAARFYDGYGTPSAQNVFNADYVKLREFNIGYTYKKPLFNSTIKQIRISGYGRNLFTWGLAKPGFDPEMTVAGSGNVQGMEGGLQPTFKTFGINLKVDI
jgi:TonB-linked SusC/RagA family outer membrane protein